MTELIPLVSEINHTISELKNWIKPKDRKTPAYLLPCKS